MSMHISKGNKPSSQDFGDREAIIDANRRLAPSLVVGRRYEFDPPVECSGIPVAMPDRIAHRLRFGSGEFVGVAEGSHRGKLPPGSLIFRGHPLQDSLAQYLFEFGIDNLPGSVISKGAGIEPPSPGLRFPRAAR